MLFFYLTTIKQIGGAGWWRVCYQRGLFRLVFIISNPSYPSKQPIHVNSIKLL